MEPAQPRLAEASTQTILEPPPFLSRLTTSKKQGHMASISKIPPGLGQIALELADDAQTIMISIYDLQKTLNGSKDPAFANARKELRALWETLRSYFQHCHGFGADVITLKDLVKTEAKEDLIDFLDEMRDSANALRASSVQLKNHDMSAAFSKGNTLGLFGRMRNYFSSGPRNANLKAFVSAVGAPKNHQLVLDIDEALLRTKSNLENAFKFWDNTLTQCIRLIDQFKSDSITMATEDADRATSDWRDYQEAIKKAIISITKTDDAILVEADAIPTSRLPMPSSDAIKQIAVHW